ncbi:MULTISPECIES: BT_3987 domain-containing protein [Bacteroides]|uniref:BT_3987 domain-containing protein n=1 Tax=Bacteroides TaxID=816 RepID=UPI0018987389|nr:MULTISPECIES: DUF1735 domain-containing protein [Bacteroides]MCE9416012.1 family 16 glycosylhydrolase [Bacteroides xylanisolvens]MCE9450356.1 family 16 glycosylhydrolase [Bacteroides xylanisolvens]MDC2730513.1 family 16 glycosylhydrolase [Bacteroides ovatus]
MMKVNKIWMVACMATAFIGGVYGCDDDKDFSYEGQLDLNLLNLTQARDVWDGAECNVTTALQQSEDETTVKNFTYKLNLSLYQGRKAEQEAKVNLVVNKDTLNKVLAKVPEGGIYAKYDGAELLPESYYHLSSQTLTLQAGETKSDAVSVTVYSSELITACQEAERNLLYVLPLTIESSSSYGVNSKTNTLMLLFNVTYVKPEEPEDQEAYMPDKVGIPDDHELENGMKLLWHDEFNGTGEPNPDIWQFETGFVRNEEDQWYQKENAKMKDGALLIEGRIEAVKNPNYQKGSSDWKKNREYSEYTSSCILTKPGYVFKYGRMEVRAKIPVEQGAWPAIWSTGNWWEWPLGGEIDMLEFYKEKIHANVCWGGNKRWEGTWNSKNYPITNFTSKDKQWPDKYHLWVMDWDKDFIRIYLDGELLNETDLTLTVNKGDNGAGQGGYQNPYSNDYEGFGQRMMLNLAIGGINGRPVDNTAFPLKYHIDYIRIYQSKK